MKRLLAVDDEVGTRVSIEAVFNGRYEVTAAASVQEAREYLKVSRPAIVLLDVVMPGEGGLEFLKELKEICPGVPVLMVSASSSPSASQKAMELGAQGVIHKPFDIHELRQHVDQVVAAAEKPKFSAMLERENSPRFDLLHCASTSTAYRDAISKARDAARRNVHVYIRGESGVGKELLARQIHQWSARAQEPYIVVRPNDSNPAKQASRLFGAAGENQIGAASSSKALFDVAEGGTVCFQRTDLSQPEVIQELNHIVGEGAFRRIDSSRPVPTETRLVLCSPSREVLDGFSSEGEQMVLIDMPALRDRKEDIPSLSEHYLRELRVSVGASALQFSEATLARLQAYHWPGNLRELRNVIERAMVLFSNERELDERCLPADMLSSRSLGEGDGLEAAVSRYEAQMIRACLKETDGNVAEAARRLNTTPRKLQYRINRLDLAHNDRTLPT